MLTRCLIANRGEIAVRVIRACRELGIGTVAVYSAADAGALHVAMADAAVALGGSSPADSYLAQERIIAAARDHGCDCVHPGYGFLSENADFAQRVLDAGLVWIGPPPDAIRRMGSKTGARALMAAAGVPLAPGFDSDTADDAAYVAAAERIGYPVMVKAAGGGGGKGIRIVRSADDLLAALAAARREAAKAFSDPRVFLEKYIERARHIEVQVFGDAHGSTVHLFERECSAQRRHQKVIEESPSPLLSTAQRDTIGAAAVEAARAVGYVNAGTVEFIATDDGAFYFLEMNTRLQVEHPVTELVTGIDLVQLQFRVAAGEALPFSQVDLMIRGHAIECRLYAEDPAAGFLPATGRVLRFTPPAGPGIRVDSAVQSGDEITIHYDPMIAKIITNGTTREAARLRMLSALRETVVLGVTTNLAFLAALLEHPAFTAGQVHTGFIESALDELLPAPDPIPDAALIALALAEARVTPAAASDPVSEGDPYSPWTRADGFRLHR